MKSEKYPVRFLFLLGDRQMKGIDTSKSYPLYVTLELIGISLCLRFTHIIDVSYFDRRKDFCAHVGGTVRLLHLQSGALSHPLFLRSAPALLSDLRRRCAP